MYRALLLVALVVSTQQLDPVTDQLVIYSNEVERPIRIMTTRAGAPVEAKEANSTFNTNLYANPYFMDKMSHFVRKNIPERIVHIRAAGAVGYFEVTHDFSHICKAELFSEIGKQTPVIARFSVGVTDKGGAETIKTPMGFALKFYTQEGNLDLLGINKPVFAIKDPILYTSLINIMKRNPVTNIQDVNMLWDFVSLNPESIFLFMMLLGEKGIPYNYRHMPGYFIHTFEVYNATGARHYCRFHLTPDAGIKYLNTTEGASIAASNPDYYTMDLYNSIANCEYPSWTLSAQILTPEDVKNSPFDVFDITKLLPLDDYPLHPIGRMVLNENPTSYFAQVEQLAVCPANLVPGILGSPDKAFEARLIFYREAQAYRLGTNYDNIKVNCPFRSTVLTYNRDGVAPVLDNGDEAPNYYPNSFDGTVPIVDDFKQALSRVYQDNSDNFGQARDYYLNEMTTEDRESFISSVVTTLCAAANHVQDRMVDALANIHVDLSKKICAALEDNNCRH